MQCPYKNKIPNTEEESGGRQGWAAPVIAFMREGKMPRKKEDMSRKKNGDSSIISSTGQLGRVVDCNR